MPGELEGTGSAVEQIRDHLHARHCSALSTGPTVTPARVVLPPAQASSTADLHARAYELGQDALAAGDEHLALKALRLLEHVADLDRRAATGLTPEDTVDPTH